MKSLLDKDLMRHVGREQKFVAPEEVGTGAIRYFAIAAEDDNPMFQDEVAAKTTRHGGIIAPPTLVCETHQILGGQPGTVSAGVDWELPLDDRRFMRSGNNYTFHRPVRPADRISVQWRISEIFERETKSGASAVYVTSEGIYRNQGGELLVSNIESHVYLK